MWQMDIPGDEDDDDYDMFMVAVAAYASLCTEKLPYAPRRNSEITGIQWVKKKRSKCTSFLFYVQDEVVSVLPTA